MSMRESIDGATREALLERGRVLLALYEGGLGFLRHAVAAHETNDAERFGHYVGRAEKVVQGLATTLDRDQGGELASILERTRGDLSLAVRQRDLENKLARFEERLGG